MLKLTPVWLVSINSNHSQQPWRLTQSVKRYETDSNSPDCLDDHNLYTHTHTCKDGGGRWVTAKFIGLFWGLQSGSGAKAGSDQKPKPTCGERSSVGPARPPGATRDARRYQVVPRSWTHWILSFMLKSGTLTRHPDPTCTDQAWTVPHVLMFMTSFSIVCPARSCPECRDSNCWLHMKNAGTTWTWWDSACPCRSAGFAVLQTHRWVRPGELLQLDVQ